MKGGVKAGGWGGPGEKSRTDFRLGCGKEDESGGKHILHVLLKMIGYQALGRKEIIGENWRGWR